MSRYIDADQLIDELARLKGQIAYAAHNEDDFPVTYGNYLGLDAAMGAIVDIVEKSGDEEPLYKRLYKELEDELSSIYDKLENAKSEVARKIFGEMDEVVKVVTRINYKGVDLGDAEPLGYVSLSEYTELKKKYTEEKK